MRPCAVVPLACMSDGCPAGRDLVRALRVASLPWRSGLTGVQPCTDVDIGRPGLGDGQLGAGWHPQDASAPAVDNSNSQ